MLCRPRYFRVKPREICHVSFRMNERWNSLFTAESRGFRTSRFSRAKHDEENHRRLALKVLVMVCDLNFLLVLARRSAIFFFFSFSIFDPWKRRLQGTRMRGGNIPT